MRRTGEKGMSRENVISRNPITKEQSILCGRRVILLLDKKKNNNKNEGNENLPPNRQNIHYPPEIRLVIKKQR